MLVYRIIVDEKIMQLFTAGCVVLILNSCVNVLFIWMSCSYELWVFNGSYIASFWWCIDLGNIVSYNSCCMCSVKQNGWKNYCVNDVIFIGCNNIIISYCYYAIIYSWLCCICVSVCSNELLAMKKYLYVIYCSSAILKK